MIPAVPADCCMVFWGRQNIAYAIYDSTFTKLFLFVMKTKIWYLITKFVAIA